MKKLLAIFLSFMFIFYPAFEVKGYFAEDSFSQNWICPQSVLEQEPTPPAQLKYQVQSGDTIWGIAQNFHLDVELIKEANGLGEESIIYPGQVLVLPCREFTIHRLAPGETLWSLARRYNVDLVHLMTRNQISDPTKISAGETIIIPVAGLPSGRSSRKEESLSWPLKGAITSSYGLRGSEFHHGIDIAAEVGENIRAADSGVVVFTGSSPIYGETVIIDHGAGIKTLYAHLQGFAVEEGDFVERGEVIGYVGNSGRSTGPHLHFEVRKNDQAVDPLPYLTR